MDLGSSSHLLLPLMHGRSVPRKQQPLSFLLPSLQLRVLAAYGALFILVLQTYLPEEILPRALLSCPPNFDDDDEDDGSRSGGGLASLGEGRGAVLMGGRAMEEWSSSLADGGGDQTRPPPPPSSGVRGFSVPVGAAATAARGGDGAGGAAGASSGGGGSGTGEGGALQLPRPAMIKVLELRILRCPSKLIIIIIIMDHG